MGAIWEERANIWFSERLGIVLETEHPDHVIQEYKDVFVDAFLIGKSSLDRKVLVVIFNLHTVEALLG